MASSAPPGNNASGINAFESETKFMVLSLKLHFIIVSVSRDKSLIFLIKFCREFAEITLTGLNFSVLS